MTQKEFEKWAKKFIKQCKKECKECKKARNGAYGILCEHCLNDWKMQINKMKKNVEEQE